jgi:hypothetical protein
MRVLAGVRVAAARLDTVSLLKMLPTCRATVFSLMHSSSAIARLVFQFFIHREDQMTAFNDATITHQHEHARSAWDDIAAGYDRFVTHTEAWLTNEALRRGGCATANDSSMWRQAAVA